MDRDEYSLKREIALSHVTTIDNEIFAIENTIKDLEKEKRKSIRWIKDLYSAKKLKKLSSDLIHSLVEKVIVDGNHNFEIIFKFDIDNLMGGASNE